QNRRRSRWRKGSVGVSHQSSATARGKFLQSGVSLPYIPQRLSEIRRVLQKSSGDRSKPRAVLHGLSRTLPVLIQAGHPGGRRHPEAGHRTTSQLDKSPPHLGRVLPRRQERQEERSPVVH